MAREYVDEDDFFASTRMSFGDHIEELRTSLLRAIYGFCVCLFIGFILDGIGSFSGLPVGVGRPMLDFMTAPIKDEVSYFYGERAWNARNKLLPIPKTDEEKVERTAEKTRFLDLWQQIANDKARPEELNQLRPLQIMLDLDALRQALAEAKAGLVPIPIKFPPLALADQLQEASQFFNKRQYLTTLSAQEALITYVKVSLLMGFIIACPWVFLQLWMFVGSGLYPHEKKYVHYYLPFSIVLFLVGVFVCQFLIFPAALKALLAFNSWLNIDPDLRLSEWLNLAILLPLVFGLSFQTPLVMLFLSRIGIFTWESYLQQWRIALMALAVFSALITPTPDVITMMGLLVPMFGLYMLGIWLCYYTARNDPKFDDDEQEIGI